MDAIGILIIVWALPAFIAYHQGKTKGRAGLLYGIVLGWLGVLILAMLPAKPHVAVERREAERVAASRECPFCKELMRRDATVCPHCRRESAPETAMAPADPEGRSAGAVVPRG